MNLESSQNDPPQFFSSLHLHKTLLSNLSSNKFTKMSPIQQYTIPELLENRNIFGLARVGSGKTLAFLIPLLQHLVNQQWGPLDGLGGLIIVPTRELGMQIFQVANQIGKGLQFTCGMICGGHKYDKEAELLDKMNILIATPGRIIQHINEYHGNVGDQLQYLVFDEIDELLEQGFLQQIKQIIDYFPKPYMEKGIQSRVTCYFSATESPRLESLLKYTFENNQMKVVNCKVNFSYISEQQQGKEFFTQYNKQYKVTEIENEKKLNTVIKVNIYQNSDSKTTYKNENIENIIAEVHEADKLDYLFSFLRSFSQNKGIIFFATCKQVQFVSQVFLRLNAGVEVIQLHSKMSQNNRQQAFYQFKQAKHAYLITTDVVARGIDITDVQFVLQIDCPQTIQQYIHRSGRCTRFANKGVNILFLCSQENAFKEMLKQQNVQFTEKQIKLKQTVSIRQALAVMVSQSQALRELAQKAVESYAVSIYVSSNKKIFDIEKYNPTLISKSYGLDVVVQRKQESESSSEPDDDEILTVQSKNERQSESLPTQQKAVAMKRPEAADMQKRITQLQVKISKTDDVDRKNHRELLRKIKYGDENSEKSVQQENSLSSETGEELGEELCDVDWEAE